MADDDIDDIDFDDGNDDPDDIEYDDPPPAQQHSGKARRELEKRLEMKNNPHRKRRIPCITR